MQMEKDTKVKLPVMDGCEGLHLTCGAQGDDGLFTLLMGNVLAPSGWKINLFADACGLTPAVTFQELRDM